MRECLFTGRIQSAWYYFQEARHSSIEAIVQNEGGSVGVVELVRIPQQPVRRRTNTMGGWTGNWTGTRGSTNAAEH